MRQQRVDGTYENLGSNRTQRTHTAATRTAKPRSLIVDKDLISLILKGQKTQVRVPGVHQYEIGNIYEVRTARGQPKRCDIEALDVYLQQLRTVTPEQAKAEGHHSLGYFLQHWTATHNTPQFDENAVVTVVVFRVWDDAPRLLTPTGKPRGSDLGYTNDPNRAMSGTADPGEGLTGRQLSHINGWRPALADIRHRETLAEALVRVRRELQGLQAELEQYPDRRTRSAVRSMQHQLDSIEAQVKPKSA